VGLVDQAVILLSTQVMPLVAAEAVHIVLGQLAADLAVVVQITHLLREQAAPLGKVLLVVQAGRILIVLLHKVVAVAVGLAP